MPNTNNIYLKISYVSINTRKQIMPVLDMYMNDIIAHEKVS